MSPGRTYYGGKRRYTVQYEAPAVNLFLHPFPLSLTNGTSDASLLSPGYAIVNAKQVTVTILSLASPFLILSIRAIDSIVSGVPFKRACAEERKGGDVHGRIPMVRPAPTHRSHTAIRRRSLRCS